jgi:thiamine-phosphate pyrophosphorylase
MKLHAVIDDIEVARAAVAAGATVVQVRLKDASTAARAEMGLRLRHLPAMLVINDDVEAALRCGADGVHLGQTDSGAERALSAGLLVGITARDVHQAKQAQALGAAYVGAGPVWATPTKLDSGVPIGIDALAAMCAAVTIPVVAIGGVDAANAGACIRSGAVGVAVVRAAADAASVRLALDAALAVSVLR